MDRQIQGFLDKRSQLFSFSYGKYNIKTQRIFFLYILEANIGWDANFLENVKMVIADYVGLQMTNKM